MWCVIMQSCLYESYFVMFMSITFILCSIYYSFEIKQIAPSIYRDNLNHGFEM